MQRFGKKRAWLPAAALPLVCIFFSCASNEHFKQGWYAEDSRNADGDTIYKNEQAGEKVPPDYARAIDEYIAALYDNEPAPLFICYRLVLVCIAWEDIEGDDRKDIQYIESLAAPLLSDYENYLAENRKKPDYDRWYGGDTGIKKLLRGVNFDVNGLDLLYRFRKGQAFQVIAEKWKKHGYHTQSAAMYEAHLALHPDDQEAKDALAEVTRLAAQKEARLAAAPAAKPQTQPAASPAKPQTPAAPAPAKAPSLAGTQWIWEKSGLVIKLIHFIDDTTWKQYEIAMFGNTDLARGTYTLSGDKLTMDGKTTTIYDGKRFQFPGDREMYLLSKTE